MTARQALILATFGSVVLMAAAYGFQHLGGMAPCKMCIWQRYPHVIAIVIGGIALALQRYSLALVGALAAATTAGVGFFHTGVEQGWWQGPSTCSSGPIDTLSPDALLEQILTAPLVRCDDIPWQMLSLSMAGWNAVISLGLCVLWLMAYRRA